MPLRDASELLYPAVRQAVAELGLLGSDAAARKLAEQYAKVIDSQDGHCRGCEDPVACRRAQGSAWAMRWLGPLLLDALTELGATPAARAAQAKGKPPADDKPTGLAKLRAAK